MLDEAFLKALLIADVDPLDKITILYDHHCTCGNQCKAVSSHGDGDAIVVVWQCSLCHAPETITYREVG